MDVLVRSSASASVGGVEKLLGKYIYLVMKNLLIGMAAIASTALFAFPAVSSAAVVINQTTLNGGSNATVPLGQTVNANTNFSISANTHIQSLSWQVVDSAGNAQLPPVCVDIPDHISDGTYNSSYPIGTGGQTEGTFGLRTRFYGDQTLGVDNQCNPSDLQTTFTQNDILTITSPTDSNAQLGNPFPGQSNGFCALFPADCSNTGTGLSNPTGFNFGNPGSSLTIFCQLHLNLCGFVSPVPTAPPVATSSTDAKLDALASAITQLANSLLNAPKGGNGESCQALSSMLDSLAVGSRGQAVSNLQVFLMQDGEHITNSGISTMYFGQLTANAVSAFKSKHGCN